MTTIQATQLVFDHFHIQGQATQLPGEIDLNFLIVVSQKEKYVFKVESSARDIDNLILQNQVLSHLATKALDLQIPKIVANKEGETITRFQKENGQQAYLRLLTWVEGRLLAKVNPHTDGLLESLGTACGNLCKGLADFRHPAAQRPFNWHNSNASWLKKHLGVFDNNPHKKELVQYFLDLFETKVRPILPTLRKSVNYNDANDYNVL